MKIPSGLLQIEAKISQIESRLNAFSGSGGQNFQDVFKDVASEKIPIENIDKITNIQSMQVLGSSPQNLIQNQIQNIISQSAKNYNVDKNLVKAVAEVESNFKIDALSSKGASGVMQLMPETAKDLGVTNAFDPYQNIDAGTKYLKKMIDRFDGDVKLGLAAYNSGPGNVEKYEGIPPFKETQNYIEKVLKLYNKYEK